MVANDRVQLDYSDVLHVAPEKEIAKFLSAKAKNYLSIDLYEKAMARMDITDLSLADSSWSLLWVSHVLEHIDDDQRAISEMYRVLKPSGTAIVQVPIWRQETYEDPSIKSAAGRLSAFFQTDHVRLYGLDIVERFRASGFSAQIIRAQDFGPEMVCRHGLSFASTNEVFVFRKET